MAQGRYRQQDQGPKSYVIIDIETRIDKALILRALYSHLPEGQMSAEDAYQTLKTQIKADSNGKSDFIPYQYHVPISIGAGVVGPERELMDVKTLGDGQDTLANECGMTREFWRLVNDGKTIVTWNGRSFDLPVLEMAALKHGIQAPSYYNEKYGARYRFSEDGHYDLFDFWTNGGAVYFRGGLNLITTLLGYAGKDGMHGSEVQQAYEYGRLDEIHEYCRHDVCLTYALFLRIEYLRGRVDRQAYKRAVDASRRYLDLIKPQKVLEGLTV